MKKTYFYSGKQMRFIHKENCHLCKINGIVYTELQNQEGEHKSNWDDAVVVHVEESGENGLVEVRSPNIRYTEKKE